MIPGARKEGAENEGGWGLGRSRFVRVGNTRVRNLGEIGKEVGGLGIAGTALPRSERRKQRWSGNLSTGEPPSCLLRGAGAVA